MNLLNIILIHSTTIVSLSFLLILGCVGCSGANDLEQDWRQLDPSDTTMIERSETSAQSLGYEHILINEINSRNKPYDWVELINVGDQDIDLTGCFVSDDPSTPMKSLFSAQMALTIKAQSYLVIGLSDATLGFKLGKADSFMISTPNGEIIDQFTYQEGAISDGEVFARIPDGRGPLMPTATATPGEINLLSYSSDQASTPMGNPTDEPTSTMERSPETNDSVDEPESPMSQDETEDQNDSPAIDSPLEPAMLVINELAAKGEPNDWVELYNIGDLPMSLSGLMITDDLGDEPFIFDQSWGQVEPKSYYLIEISNDTVGFKLGSDEAFYLLDEDGIVLDELDWEEGDSPEEMSLARSIDGSGEFVMSDQPTPGQTNQ